MKIIVDTFGADNGESVILGGCLPALDDYKNLEFVFCGDSESLTKLLNNYKYDESRVKIIDAKEGISNEEHPVNAIKTKKDSTLVKALEAAANDDAAALISAGSTGAVLAGSLLKIGRIKSVYRPALTPLLPSFKGGAVALCDCGANMDCRPEYIAQFALMGSEYMKAMGVENPKVGLVSVGVEDKKGNEQTLSAFKKIKELPLNFAGNMEARDALTGEYDVLVCDGFVGNVLLKSVEGTAKFILKLLKKEIEGSATAKLGALFMGGAFKRLKKRTDYQTMGGAVFLGVKKIVVKAHGSANTEAIRSVVDQTVKLCEMNLPNRIESVIDKTKDIIKGDGSASESVPE